MRLKHLVFLAGCLLSLASCRKENPTSSSEDPTGKHYYYNIATGDTDTVGPFSDLEFYEAWVYYFLPEGDHIKFW